mmetsp:Transcript_24988/g.34228  ORF Transcript_24988/g.34228 Transcript_24988/m.34228 type:complete len:96 (-) Transcript_24988:555-842(-)
MSPCAAMKTPLITMFWAVRRPLMAPSVNMVRADEALLMTNGENGIPIETKKSFTPKTMSGTDPNVMKDMNVTKPFWAAVDGSSVGGGIPRSHIIT